MSFSTFITGVRLLSHSLAYSPAANPLATTLHLRPGSKDIWVPVGGTIDRRPGIKTLYDDAGAALVDITRHVVAAEDGSLAATAYNKTSKKYQVWYKDVSAAWLKVPNNRRINSSVSPHEMLWIGRKLYVKGNPTGDKIGAIVFDLDHPARSHWWGLLRPSAAPTFAATSSWQDSGTDSVKPIFGARYAYTFISSTGHESSISNFTDHSAKINGKYPRLRFPAASANTDITHFRIYRSPDGGGRLFFVEEVENIGRAITWNDTHFTAGGNFSSGINFSRPAPGPDTNDPPPPIESGEIGVDAIERCTPIVEWAGRIVFGVGKNLYYSVNDEAVPGSGVLQESFRGGSILRPNRATFREKILDVLTTTHGVYIFTTKNTYIMTGERRSELRFRQIYPDIGIHDRHCSTPVGGDVVWLDQNLDLRTAASGLESEGSIPAILSSPLKGEQAAHPDQYIRVDTHHIVGYLLVSIFVGQQLGTKLTPIPQDAVSTVFVFDALRKFWFAPWHVEATTIWERFHVVNFTTVGRLDISTHGDFGHAIPKATIVTSSSLVIGEADLNVTDADFGFQCAEGVELTWQGTNLVNGTVKILVEGISDDPADFVSCPRGDGVVRAAQGMRHGKFWLPTNQAAGRYFAIHIAIPSGQKPWSLLNALFIFSKLMSDQNTR